MELIGWILSGVLFCVIIGMVIAFTLFPTVNVEQTNNVSQSNNNAGGGNGDHKVSGGSVVPALAIGAILIASVAAISQSAQSAAQVSAVSQTALTTQREIAQALPQPTAQPVTIYAPQAVSFGEVIVTSLTAINLAVWGVAGVMFIRGKRITRRRSIKEIASKPIEQGITHPAFNQALLRPIKKSNFHDPLGPQS
jgi:hypothetical protein